MSFFSYEFISAIAKYLSRQTYSPGEIIYYEGEQADDYLYFVEEGTSKSMAITFIVCIHLLNFY